MLSITQQHTQQLRLFHWKPFCSSLQLLSSVLSLHDDWRPLRCCTCGRKIGSCDDLLDRPDTFLVHNFDDVARLCDNQSTLDLHHEHTGQLRSLGNEQPDNLRTYWCTLGIKSPRIAILNMGDLYFPSQDVDYSTALGLTGVPDTKRNRRTGTFDDSKGRSLCC